MCQIVLQWQKILSAEGKTKMNQRITAIGELLIDFIPQTKGQPLYEVECFTRVAGGAPANVAVAVARLGGEAAMISQVGNDAFGTYLLKMLADAGVDTSAVFRTGQANTGLAFVSLDSSGNRDFSFYRNPSADLFLSPEQLTPSLFQTTGILHFCSVDLVDAPVKQAHRSAIALAKEAGAMISFDPNVRLPLWDFPEDCADAVREFLPYGDIVKISDDEIDFLFGTGDPAKVAAELLGQGATAFLYTKGAAGAELFTRAGHTAVPGCPVKVLDTTGAGDAFIGAFLWQLAVQQLGRQELNCMVEEKRRELLTFACRYAAYTTTKPGGAAAMANQEELASFYRIGQCE